MLLRFDTILSTYLLHIQEDLPKSKRNTNNIILWTIGKKITNYI